MPTRCSRKGRSRRWPSRTTRGANTVYPRAKLGTLFASQLTLEATNAGPPPCSRRPVRRGRLVRKSSRRNTCDGASQMSSGDQVVFCTKAPTSVPSERMTPLPLEQQSPSDHLHHVDNGGVAFDI